MTAFSDAVGSERLSQIIGYKIEKGNFAPSTGNLPQRVVILGEANTANQGTLDLTPKQFNNSQAVGAAYGYGSPMYAMARILFPKQSSGIGGIPVIFSPQAQAAGATAKVITISPLGVATGNGTHKLIIAGRDNVDGVSYAINIVQGDTTDDVTAKISDSVNNVLGAPFIGTDTQYLATLTSKWKGKTANDLSVSVDTGDDDLGLTYSVVSLAAGAGTPSVQAALDLFGNSWNTIVINPFTDTNTMDLLEAFNGVPSTTTPTGRYQGIVMKPFIALTGSVLDDPTSITDSRDEEVTIAICPAPNSKGLPMEAAANMCVLFARVSQDTPHLDVSSRSYPDMPTPTTIGSMADYNNRDAFVKKGCSTVDLVNEKYQVMDFVTTYHPAGETPWQFSYCRNLMIDFNVRFGYYLLEQINVVGHAIAADEDQTTAVKVIKPKQWKQILNSYANELATRSLIAKADFMQASIEVSLSSVNPDRFNTVFDYKRSGYIRISSTTVTAGFNFGDV